LAMLGFIAVKLHLVLVLTTTHQIVR